MKSAVKLDSTGTIGFWSAVSTTVWSILFLIALIFTFVVRPLDLNWQGIAQYAAKYDELQVMMFVVPCFLLAPSILILAVSLYSKAPQEKKILALLAMVFAIVYVSQISYNYFMQMTAVRQSIKASVLEGLTPFAFGNYNSTFWSLEVLGYTWLSISMVFMGLLFRGGKLKAAIRWILLVNGILGVWALFEAVLSITTPPISLVLFAVTFPISTWLIAWLFKRDSVF